MNSAARLHNQGTLSQATLVSIFVSRSQMILIALIIAVLISALNVIYVTNYTRSLHADIHEMIAEKQKLHLEWEQLLLEKSTWLTQIRVQSVAEKQMNMMVPNQKTVVVIKE